MNVRYEEGMKRRYEEGMKRCEEYEGKRKVRYEKRRGRGGKEEVKRRGRGGEEEGKKVMYEESPPANAPTQCARHFYGIFSGYFRRLFCRQKQISMRSDLENAGATRNHSASNFTRSFLI